MGSGVRLRLPMVRVDRAIEAPPEAVWSVLVDLDAWPRWGPTISGAALDDGGKQLTAGSTGRVWALPGVSVPFTVTEFDAGRRWAWSVVGVPATAHGVESAPGGCRAWFEVPIWAAPYAAVCAIALRRIETLAATRT
ncbi:SRPBCC family protein [Mycobacterium sp. EPa45]|uniref:SRPBCC family protein n=1 Tax=Mycobacterium sp. EPa45 TaxID=1545728 RepID=UPI0006426345|nr:SRPBCC family protein [Mycobacterium sp. EPa45]AKK28032.1 polyketide cyclase [Mycobacterium sp. EPa45]